MPDITDSIDKLTDSLQQLTADESARQDPIIPANLPVQELRLSPGVKSFVERNREYEDATRSVSVGTY